MNPKEIFSCHDNHSSEDVCWYWMTIWNMLMFTNRCNFLEYEYIHIQIWQSKYGFYTHVLEGVKVHWQEMSFFYIGLKHHVWIGMLPQMRNNKQACLPLEPWWPPTSFNHVLEDCLFIFIINSHETFIKPLLELKGVQISRGTPWPNDEAIRWGFPGKRRPPWE